MMREGYRELPPLREKTVGDCVYVTAGIPIEVLMDIQDASDAAGDASNGRRELAAMTAFAKRCPDFIGRYRKGEEPPRTMGDAYAPKIADIVADWPFQLQNELFDWAFRGDKGDAVPLA